MEEFRSALVTIANADSGAGSVNSITARTEDNMKPWANIAELPAEGIAYQIVDEGQTPAEGEQREITVQFSCFAKTITRASTLAKRVTSEGTGGMFTYPKFAAQAVNAVPLRFTERDATGLEDDGRKEHRIDVDGVFSVEFRRTHSEPLV